MDTSAQPDVLIVGAGPTGLTAAGVLAALGTRTRVVDAGDGPTVESRALIVQARTLELWDKQGLAAQAVRDGTRLGAVAVLREGAPPDGGTPLLDLHAVGGDATPFPFLLIHEQSRTERLLSEHLRSVGGDVEWQTRAGALRQHGEHVEVELHHEGGRELVRPRWVIGADGAGSVVRHALGLAFDGGTYEQAFFLADVDLDGDLPRDRVTLARTGGGVMAFLPMSDEGDTARSVRILGTLTPEMAGREPLDVTDVQRAVDVHSGLRARIADARWIATYRLHHRMAPRLRVGRTFLAGDAAHVHSPVGGQGMNTGIQDAYNLAWKLGLVVSGAARPHLLDSYEAERLPVARALLQSTDRGFALLVSRGRLGRWLERPLFALVPRALALPGLRRRIFRLVSQIGVGYEASPAVAGSTAPRAAPGARAPHARFAHGPRAGTSILAVLGGTAHHLLLFPGARGAADLVATSLEPLLAELGVRIEVHVIEAEEIGLRDAYAAIRPTMILVRPDGHVAWRGALHDIRTLTGYLAAWYASTTD